MECSRKTAKEKAVCEEAHTRDWISSRLMTALNKVLPKGMQMLRLKLKSCSGDSLVVNADCGRRNRQAGFAIGKESSFALDDWGLVKRLKWSKGARAGHARRGTTEEVHSAQCGFVVKREEEASETIFVKICYYFLRPQ